MAVAGGTLAMLIRLQIAWSAESWPRLEKLMPHAMQGGVMKPEFYLSLVTMHGTIMVFFVISMELIGAFGNYLAPLHAFRPLTAAAIMFFFDGEPKPASPETVQA